MAFKSLVFAVAIALVLPEFSSGRQRNVLKRSADFSGGPSHPAKYSFNYAVKDESSGNDFGHRESRDGDFTDGEYYVLLPDGRFQTVTYIVEGGSGFQAEVNYEDRAKTSGNQKAKAMSYPNYG